MLKLLDTFILGSVAILIYETLNILLLQDVKLKNHIKNLEGQGKMYKPISKLSIKNLFLNFNLIKSTKIIIILIVLFLTFRKFGLISAIVACFLTFLIFYYYYKHPLTNMEIKENENHIMNYTYSYFGGIFAAIAIAMVLGQNPLKWSWNAILSFLLITFSAGLICCTIIKFAFYKKYSKK